MDKIAVVEDNDNDFELRADFYYSMKELEEYGYVKDDMYPINKERADHLFELGLPIFLLYSDNESEKVEKTSQLSMFKGAIGIEKKAWTEFLQTDKGASFAFAWEFISNAAQSLRIDKELQYGKFTSLHYEYLYGEETSCLENFFDERYEQKGDITDDLTDIVKHTRLYTRIIWEYAERLNEMFMDTGIEGLTTTSFLVDLISEVANRYVSRTEYKNADNG